MHLNNDTVITWRSWQLFILFDPHRSANVRRKYRLGNYLRRWVEVRNSTQRFRSQERTIQGICSKGLLRKSTYSCGNNVIVKFKNPNYNTFVVKIAAVNDTDTFVKPRECKIGDIQHTSQLIPRNRDEKVDHFSRFKVLTLTFHPMKFCSLFYNTNSQ